MDILEVGNSAEKLKISGKEQLNSVQIKFMKKQIIISNKDMGSSQRAFEYLSL